MNRKLKILMIKKGVKNFDLAKHLSVDPAKISKIVNGWIVPDETLKKSIADFLAVPVTSIWSKANK